MTHYCLICGCSEDEVEKMFCFPRNAVRCRVWQQNLGIAYRPKMTTTNRVCNKHFSKEWFIPQTATLKLKSNAVPIPWKSSSSGDFIPWNFKMDCQSNVTTVVLNSLQADLPRHQCVSGSTSSINNVPSKTMETVPVSSKTFPADHENFEMGWKPCSVPDCQSKDGVRFRFPHPVQGRQRFKKWLEIIKNPLLDSLPPLSVYNLKRLCANHFEAQYFIKPNKLKYSAIPTLLVADPDAGKDWNYADSTDYFPGMRTSLNLGAELSTNKDESQPQDILSGNSDEQSDPTPVPPIPSKKAIDERCRVCLIETDNGLPLNYTTNIPGGESLTLSEIINKFCNVDVSDDDSKPHSICIDCAEKARAVFEFCACCTKTNKILQEEMIENLDPGTIVFYVDEEEFSKIDNLCKESSQVPTSPATEDYNTPNQTKEQSCATQKLSKVTEQSSKNSKKQSDNSTNRRQRGKSNQNIRLLNKCKQCSFYNRKAKQRVSAKSSGAEPDLKQAVICLQCYTNYKKQSRFKLYNGLFIRKKQYTCGDCGARFPSSKKLCLHQVTHRKNLLYGLLNNKSNGKLRLKSYKILRKR